MLYLPAPADINRFNVLTSPLPPHLLSWLTEERGLGIWVLPHCQATVKRILFDHLLYEDDEFKGDKRDKRKKSETSFYDAEKRIVVLTYNSFWQSTGENILLHELGHAVDHLYLAQKWGSRKAPAPKLSLTPEFYDALNPGRMLNDYCRKKAKVSGGMLDEQFACSFAAYFQEPETDKWANHIGDLTLEFIGLMKRYIIEPFGANHG